MIVQLSPPIPILTPKGPGIAHAVIDYGVEHHLLWVCFQDDTGECWTWPNPKIRAQKNISQGRTNISPYNPEDMEFKALTQSEKYLHYQRWTEDFIKKMREINEDNSSK